MVLPSDVDTVVTTTSTSVGLNFTTVETVGGDTDGFSISIPGATTSKAGVISAADKTKLDSLSTNTMNYRMPSQTIDRLE